jgi:hypothetical protein
MFVIVPRSRPSNVWPFLGEDAAGAVRRCYTRSSCGGTIISLFDGDFGD